MAPCNRVFVFAVLLLFLLVVPDADCWWSRRRRRSGGSGGSGSSGGSGGSSCDDSSFSQDMDTMSGLTDLYRRRVIHVDNYERTQSGMEEGSSHHPVVVVTTEDGERWLIHQGSSDGHANQPVIVRASCMSSRWHYVSGHNVRGYRVSDYIEAAGLDYSMSLNNEHDARGRMVEL